MDPAHLHLMLNHIPVLGTAFGMALIAWALFRKMMVRTANLGGLIRHQELRPDFQAPPGDSEKDG